MEDDDEKREREMSVFRHLQAGVESAVPSYSLSAFVAPALTCLIFILVQFCINSRIGSPELGTCVAGLER